MRPADPPSRRIPRSGRGGAPGRTWALTAAFALLAASLASPSAAQGPGAPLDRTVVAMPPVYPTPAAGSFRLPETRSAPITPAGALHAPVTGGGGPGLPEARGDRPVWRPARLEAVPAIDAHARLTAILEYTPGRFDR